MIKVDKANVTFEGTFHTLLTEMQTIIYGMDEMLVENPQLKVIFNNKTILEILNDVAEFNKEYEASGLSPEEFVKTHKESKN